MTASVQQVKLLGETKFLSEDFASDLVIGVTISTKVVTASVFSGTDASPSTLISGAATSSGTVVSQKVTGGVLGVLYELLWQVTTSDGQTLQHASFLAIAPDLA